MRRFLGCLLFVLLAGTAAEAQEPETQPIQIGNVTFSGSVRERYEAWNWFEPAGGNKYVIGDGAVWYLVDEKMLLDLTEKMNAILVDPLKTTIVQDYRCMTTWVLRKLRQTREG